jgi:hypothetical protein
LYPWRGGDPSFAAVDDKRNCIVVPEKHDWASPEADAKWEAYSNAIEDRIEEKPHLEYFLERTDEMAVRIATIMAVDRNIGNYDFKVDLADVDWAIQLTDLCSKRLVAEAGEMIGAEETKYTKDIKRVERIILDSPRIKHSDLVKAVKHFMNAKALKEILATVDESEKLVRHQGETPKGGGPRPVFYELRQ